jgi:catechol 2,3-dioxygenase-like lactoylglutathione lyase family enzyme
MAETQVTADGMGMVLAHFIVSDDVERSRGFYTEALGGKTVWSGEPSYVALVNAGSSLTAVAAQPTISRPSRSSLIGPVASSTSGSLTSGRVLRVERGGILDTAETASDRDALLPARSGRAPD